MAGIATDLYYILGIVAGVYQCTWNVEAIALSQTSLITPVIVKINQLVYVHYMLYARPKITCHFLEPECYANIYAANPADFLKFTKIKFSSSDRI